MGASLMRASHFLLLCLLALSLFTLDCSDAANIGEVRLALKRASQRPQLRVAAQTFLKLMNTRWGRWLNYGPNVGPVTILLPGNFAFIRYRFQKLKPAQTINLFNYNMIKGKHDFVQLFKAAPGRNFFTTFQSKPLRRAYNPRNMVWRIGTKAQGRRRTCEVLSTIILPNVYIGNTVNVQGVNCFLTPPDFKGGPFWSLIR